MKTVPEGAEVHILDNCVQLSLSAQGRAEWGMPALPALHPGWTGAKSPAEIPSPRWQRAHVLCHSWAGLTGVGPLWTVHLRASACTPWQPGACPLCQICLEGRGAQSCSKPLSPRKQCFGGITAFDRTAYGPDQSRKRKGYSPRNLNQWLDYLGDAPLQSDHTWCETAHMQAMLWG